MNTEQLETLAVLEEAELQKLLFEQCAAYNSIQLTIDLVTRNGWHVPHQLRNSLGAQRSLIEKTLGDIYSARNT